MLFCTTCGRYLSEYDVICPECGTVIHPEALVAEPYRYRRLVFVLSLIAFAAVAFILSYYLDAFFFLVFIPFLFFGWDSSRPLTYVVSGMSIGVGIGLVAAWIYRFSGLF
ncbi:MAG: hypothetical protein J5673_01040 [Candidatus Methanomethylophilaceae archaeon]|nr:hypothetical protein [Candidatus Methanomethylophilaceae archaeon]